MNGGPRSKPPHSKACTYVYWTPGGAPQKPNCKQAYNKFFEIK